MFFGGLAHHLSVAFSVPKWPIQQLCGGPVVDHSETSRRGCGLSSLLGGIQPHSKCSKHFCAFGTQISLPFQLDPLKMEEPTIQNKDRIRIIFVVPGKECSPNYPRDTTPGSAEKKGAT